MSLREEGRVPFFIRGDDQSPIDKRNMSDRKNKLVLNSKI